MPPSPLFLRHRARAGAKLAVGRPRIPLVIVVKVDVLLVVGAAQHLHVPEARRRRHGGVVLGKLAGGGVGVPRHVVRRRVVLEVVWVACTRQTMSINWTV